jgi:hypothetical protein
MVEQSEKHHRAQVHRDQCSHCGPCGPWKLFVGDSRGRLNRLRPDKIRASITNPLVPDMVASVPEDLGRSDLRNQIMNRWGINNLNISSHPSISLAKNHNRLTANRDNQSFPVKTNCCPKLERILKRSVRKSLQLDD